MLAMFLFISLCGKHQQKYSSHKKLFNFYHVPEARATNVIKSNAIPLSVHKRKLYRSCNKPLNNGRHIDLYAFETTKFNYSPKRELSVTKIYIIQVTTLSIVDD